MREGGSGDGSDLVGRDALADLDPLTHWAELTRLGYDNAGASTLSFIKIG